MADVSATTAASIDHRSLPSISRLVIKLGSSTVRDVPLEDVAAVVKALRERKVEVCLVSSGAVACGLDSLGLKQRPTQLHQVQALAAVGQVDLMSRWQRALGQHDLLCGQVLLTHQALSDRRHFLNVRHTLSGLLSLGVVPIANENDTVATEELRFGDNDRLAAAIGTVIDADLVILLSDIDALYDADPREDPEAAPIHDVHIIDQQILDAAGSAGSEIGTGGMASKVQAAQLATEGGIPLVIAAGDDPKIILQILDGQPLGTFFHGARRRPNRRRHWIANLGKVCGTVHVDRGAAVALQTRGSSLLPIGVSGVEGTFERGEIVRVLDPEGELVAQGVVGYDSTNLVAVLGLRTDAIQAAFNVRAVDPVIHRNDLALMTDE